MSKRNYKRLVKKQSSVYQNRNSDNICGENEVFAEYADNIVDTEQTFEEQYKDLSAPKLKLREKLKKWYIETSPSRKCVEQLLAILHEEGLDVPLSATALMGKRHECTIRKVLPGSYCHIGIENQLRKVEEISQKFDSYKDAAQKQYSTIVDILAEHKVLLDRINAQNTVTSNMMQIFPVENEEKLRQLDAILSTKADPYIRQMKTLLGGNAERNLHLIFGQNIIMNFNVDGLFGKKRLKDYEHVFSATIDVISTFSDASDKTLRCAFQRQKKKFFKQTSRNKTLVDKTNLQASYLAEKEN